MNIGNTVCPFRCATNRRRICLDCAVLRPGCLPRALMLQFEKPLMQSTLYSPKQRHNANASINHSAQMLLWKRLHILRRPRRASKSSRPFRITQMHRRLQAPSRTPSRWSDSCMWILWQDMRASRHLPGSCHRYRTLLLHGLRPGFLEPSVLGRSS